MGDPENQFWESNRGQQWLSITGQIKIFQGFCWGQNFVLFTYQTHPSQKTNLSALENGSTDLAENLNINSQGPLIK